MAVVFISSTYEDLEDYRNQAKAAALAHGFLPEVERLPASGHPALDECLRKVEKADLMIVIVAHLYGSVPDQTDPKSFTWRECEHAWSLGKEVLAFLVDPDHPWPAELKEDYRLIGAKNLPLDQFIEVAKEVKRNEALLEKFKAELRRHTVQPFTGAPNFRALVSEALAHWQKRHPEASPVAIPGDPEPYLKWLEDQTRQIRIRGLTSKRAEPYFFGIDEIYIPLTTMAAREHAAEKQRVVLEEALSERKVVIVGEPGSGKSTFLQRTAFELCRTLRGSRQSDDRRFPILIRIADLSRVLAEKSARPDYAPGWLPYFLGKQSEEHNWGLEESFFRNKLKEGNCLVMVDGLDEAPDRWLRERIARLFENATASYGKCGFLVSTRPKTYLGDSVLADFHPMMVDDLEAKQIAEFLDRFGRALALGPAESKKFKDGLEDALAVRREIEEMARNPLMLTALAVLQHNDQRLPEHRVDLYEQIVGWLAAARKEKPGRPPAEKCLLYMRALALRMQNADGGRVVQMNQREAAEFWAATFGGTADENEDLLEHETHDSGIVSAVGTDLKFWHLSFQEYLAAREIAGLGRESQSTLVAGRKLYRPEWRETARLLACVLLKQGAEKVEELFTAILEQMGPQPGLAARAQCAGLLGAMMRDLARMGFQPKTPDYERTVKSVTGIFDVAAAESLDFTTRLEAADVLGQVGDRRLDEDNWVLIPGGTFRMGEGDKVHEVRLKPFRIRRFPVTVQEFGAFLATGKVAAPEDWGRQQQYPNRPVVGVSWFDATAYCEWKGVRLPTEAEWERAARGPESWEYPWGNEPPLDETRANYNVNVGHVTPVGLYPKGNSSEGLCDMLGNVWEWCADWYGPYETGRQNDPRGPKDGKDKVVRGGCWLYDTGLVRASLRLRYVPTARYVIIGFRCVGELS